MSTATEPHDPAAAADSAPPAAAAAAPPLGLVAWLDRIAADEKRAAQLVFGAGFLLFFPYLGSLGLWDPWETHYGEVARAMIQRGDYVYPYWESAYFFSKPALTLWLMALGMLAVGAESAPAGEPLSALTEWGVRAPFALIAIGCMWAAYRIGRQIGGAAAGVLAAVILGTCPQFIFIGKQTMTDGPFVGLMSIGLALFMAAAFDREEDAKATRFHRALTSGLIVVCLGPQLLAIGAKVEGSANLLALVGAGVLGAGFVAAVWLVATRRDCYLAGFYVFMGLSVLAKGLAPLAVVGPTVLLYCMLSHDWQLLVRSRWLVGGVLMLLIASPWYVTLTLFKGRDDEGLTFKQRFWFHDNFNRVGAGVHGDRAGMGYFLEQLAYGMFPWSATLPFALGLAAKTARDEEDVQKRRAVLFVLLWAVWCYVFFSASLTKFHHYIFPAVPALAVLAGLFAKWVAERPADRVNVGMAVIVLGLFATVIRDLVNEPNSLVNLFTYKYDREWPREIRLEYFVLPITIAGGLATVELFSGFRLTRALPWLLSALFQVACWPYERLAALDAKLAAKLPGPRPDRGVLAFVIMSVVFGVWVSHHHFNMLSQHWSQYHLFDTYFDEKKGDEPIYAYQLNWRGETFYSRNRVLQVKEGGANQRMKSLVDEPGREFIITEQSRFHTLKSILSPEKQEKLQIIDRSNNHFYLCVVED